ncbi:TPA: antibiotic biosynthesis monooxygenase [Pseudomonas putida]
MIYEIAVLPIHPTQIDPFRQAFADVAPLLARAPGHITHVLAQGVESPHEFNLIVHWQSLSAHTPDFEASDDHQLFMSRLEPYFSAEPRVYHVEGSLFAANAPAAANSLLAAEGPGLTRTPPSH